MITFILIGSVLYMVNKSQAGTTSQTPVTATTFDHLFKAEAAANGINWKMLKAIAMNESSLGKHPSVARGLAFPSDVNGSKSDDGLSWGLMQVTLATGGDFDPSITPAKLNDPAYSVKIAARYVAWTVKQWKDDPQTEWIVKSYNQGVGNTRKERAGVILPRKKEVQEYWERYLRNYEKIKHEV